jgi:nucleotidyltransferase substrate binding protein (TIGR01987 family)
MEDLKFTRFKQRFDNFEKSFEILAAQASKKIESDESIGALLHFFEISFELSWKVIKDYLDAHGVQVRSPREALKTAFQMGLLEDGYLWLEMLDARNDITHSYNQELAKELCAKVVGSYFPAFKQFHKSFSKEM